MYRTLGQLTKVSTKTVPLPLTCTYGATRFTLYPATMVPKKFILLALLSACPALANTLFVNGVDGALGMGPFGSTRINSWDSREIPVEAQRQVYWAGAIDITVDNYIRQVFCVQLFTEIGIGGTYNTTMDFSDTPNLERLGWLLENEFPTTPLEGAAFNLLSGTSLRTTGMDSTSARSPNPPTPTTHPRRPLKPPPPNTKPTASPSPLSTAWSTQHHFWRPPPPSRT